MEQDEQLQLNEVIAASLITHHDHVQLQASEHLAQSLQQQEGEEQTRQLTLALHESFSTNKKQKLNQELNAYATNYTVDRSEGRHAGCWDCPSCTLVNIPYASKCSACRAIAPSHVLTFEELPSLRFGLEVEIVIPYGKTDGFSLQSIAKDLTSLGPEKVEFLGYTHATSDCWKIVTDSSIQANNGVHKDLCFELVSPILQGEAERGLGQMRNIMDNVRKIGIETNASCGFHVHVDAEEGSQMAGLSALKALSQCFIAVENAFDLLVSNDNGARRRTNQNTYCRSNRIAFAQKSNRQRWNEITSVRNKFQLVRKMNPNNDRFRKINLTNIVKDNRPSTCEFRHHGGVQDLQEAETWVRLILGFCYNATNSDMAKGCLLHEDAKVKDEVRALFDLVGCQGLEQFFTVDRQLFAEERLKNEWRCKICRRGFVSSRSLSQHCEAVGHRMH